nr:hypothetical protein [Tanacetum cinerariifolium]
MWETDSYKSHEVHMQLFEALEKSINRDQSEELAHDLAETRMKRKKGRESPKMPPGSPSHQPPSPPLPAGPSGTSGAPRASGSQVTPPPPPPTSTNQDSPSTGSVAPSPAKTAATTEHQAWSTPDTGDITTFMDWFCKRRGITELKPQDLEGPAYEIVIVFHPDMKAAYYPDTGLEQMVPDQFWIEEECKYDVATMYGISHWWFQRQRFYIDRHTSEGDRSTFRTHMRILSVVRIEVFSMYGYDYMKKIV